MGIIFKRFYLAFLLVIMACFWGEASAEEDVKAKAIEQDRQGLVIRLKESLKGYDVNALEKHFIDSTFSTFHAMSAYRGLLEWSAEEADDETLRAEIISLVREGMVAIVRDSGAGVPLTGWDGVGQPISVIYGGSMPRYQQRPDFNEPKTLEWDQSYHAKLISPATVGQSLAAKSLLILSDDSDAAMDINKVMLYSLLNELDIFASQFFWKDQGQLGAVTQGAYMPHELRMVGESQWEIKSAGSSLLAQASLLQGLVLTHGLLGDDNRINKLIVDGKIAGKELRQWRELLRLALDEVYSFIVARHYDSAAGSFVSDYKPASGTGDRILMGDAAEIVGALETIIQVFPENDPLNKSSQDYILAQAQFIREGLEKRRSRMPRGFLLKRKIPLYGLVQEFTNYTAAMSVFIVAQKYNENQGLADLAKNHFEEADKIYWSEQSKIYRVAEGHKVAAFDGHNFSHILKWLSQMNANFPMVVDFDQRRRDFFQVVIKDGGLLQGEGPANGEIRMPEDYFEKEIPDLADSLVKTAPVERDSDIVVFMKEVADQDSDGVPGCRFAGGANGAAPVIVKQISVSTPFIASGAGEKNQIIRNYGF